MYVYTYMYMYMYMYPYPLYVLLLLLRLLLLLQIKDSRLCIVRLESTTPILRASGIDLFVLHLHAASDDW